MKFSNQKTHSLPLIAMSSLLCVMPTNLHAQAASNAPIPEQKFASPEEALATLKTDVQRNDRAGLLILFGTQFNELVTGDEVQDTTNIKHFASQMEQSCHLVHDSADKIEIEVGSEHWPLPIPLVRADGQWHFDTAAGKEELINRHIGQDELSAIGVCRSYVIAQERYAEMNPNHSSEKTYAQHLKSNSGQKDGLYWVSPVNGVSSPLSQLIAEAQDEGYVLHPRHTGRHPFHGYYFRVLTQQGEAAKGGAQDYKKNGNMTGGFALIAYPEHWGQSGIMTFIVGKDGKVYQCDLGEQTDALALAMKAYNPTPEWTLVPDEGVNLAQ